jgi:hypothetical protein
MFVISLIAFGVANGTKPGDVDDDGVVGLSDLILTAKAWHSTPADPNWDSRCDWNGDGIISLADLVFVAIHFEG